MKRTSSRPNNDPTLAEAWLHGNGVTDPETGAVATYNDDYFITPKVSLKAGKDYRLSFDWGDNFYYGEKMNIFLMCLVAQPLSSMWPRMATITSSSTARL